MNASPSLHMRFEYQAAVRLCGVLQRLALYSLIVWEDAISMSRSTTFLAAGRQWDIANFMSELPSEEQRRSMAIFPLRRMMGPYSPLWDPDGRDFDEDKLKLLAHGCQLAVIVFVLSAGTLLRGTRKKTIRGTSRYGVYGSESWHTALRYATTCDDGFRYIILFSARRHVHAEGPNFVMKEPWTQALAIVMTSTSIPGGEPRIALPQRAYDTDVYYRIPPHLAFFEWDLIPKEVFDRFRRRRDRLHTDKPLRRIG